MSNSLHRPRTHQPCPGDPDRGQCHTPTLEHDRGVCFDRGETAIREGDLIITRPMPDHMSPWPDSEGRRTNQSDFKRHQKWDRKVRRSQGRRQLHEYEGLPVADVLADFDDDPTPDPVDHVDVSHHVA